MSSESKLKDRKSSQEPTAAFCPANRFSKGQNHHMSDWSYWADRNPDLLKHPYCMDCGYVDRSRILDSWQKRHTDNKRS